MNPSDIHIDDFYPLIDNEAISHISFDYELEAIADSAEDTVVMSWDDVLDTINATDIVEDQIYTGSGVRIGILEAGGICDDTHPSLAGIDITYYNASQTLHNHATCVTAILYAIAPDAEYYLDTTRHSTRLTWFIDQGCDIINCSWGHPHAISIGNNLYEGATSNTYQMHQDGYYDYIVGTLFITIVKSAGNVNNDQNSQNYNPNAIITNPGYAYNVITVGGVNFQSYNSSRIVHASNAAYVSGSGFVKPNISAPYSITIPGIGVSGGTSLSTPMVSAGIALLFEAFPRISSYPEIAMAVVTASAQETYDYSNDFGYIDEKVGTGALNISGMLDIADNRYYDYDSNWEGELDEVFYCDVYLDEGDILQVSATWLVRNDGNENSNPTEIYFSDYDLIIMDEDSVFLEQSLFSQESNVEFIRFEAPEYGTYTIVVSLFSYFEPGGNDIDNLAMAYCIK